MFAYYSNTMITIVYIVLVFIVNDGGFVLHVVSVEFQKESQLTVLDWAIALLTLLQ